MAFLQWNCRGYRHNYEDLICLLKEHSPKCVCLQETFLGAFLPHPPKGYSIQTFSPTNQATPGNGLAILIHQSIPYNTIAINSNLQVSAVRIGLHTQYTVCNLYIHPNENITSQDLLNLINQLPQPFIILGDFNAKHPLWGNRETDRHGRVIEQILMDPDIGILNDGHATHFHVQTGTSSAIDLSLCSPIVQPDLVWTVLDDLYGSDHYPILITNETSNDTSQREPRLILRKADWKLFKSLTAVVDGEYDNIDEMVEVFNKLVLDATRASIPMSSGRIPDRCVPWWTADCTIVNLERKAALRRYQRTRLQVDKISYSRAKANAKFVKHNAKVDSMREFISKLNSDTPLPKIWIRVKKMTGKYAKHHPPCLTQNNNLVTDEHTVANILAHHYSSVSSTDSYTPRFQRVKAAAEATHINFDSNENHPYNSPITMHEVTGTMKLCKETAPGEDGIRYRMLSNIHDSALNLLLGIYNKVWTDNVYPSEWRDATVLSFLKPSKPRTEPGSYRPIALTSCTGKLLEKVVNIRLVNFLEKNQILSDKQFGFRKMRSTTDALICLESEIVEAFRRKNHLVCVFFDINKAYDTTWKYNIIRSLHSGGVRGHMGKYIANFLHNRTFRAKIGNSFSDSVPQEEGVPQGSVLSCTLFALAINNIAENLPIDVKYSLYVDDLMIYTSSSSIPSIERRLQNSIRNITSWTDTNGFTLSAPKTVAVHFHRKRGLQPEPSLFLYNQPIKFDTTQKFLGMILDQKLTWKPHIDKLKQDCMGRLNLLKCISRQSWGADRKTMLRIYKAMILSKIDYGSIVYSSAKDNVLCRLDPVHNAALRLCTGAFKSSPVISLYADSGVPPLAIRREKLCLQYSMRLKQLPDSAVSLVVQQQHQRRQNETMRTFSFGDRTRQLTENVQFPVTNVIPNTFINVPFWDLPQSTFCGGFKYGKKEDHTSNSLRLLFYDHLYNEHENSSLLFTDGSKDENNVGCACVAGNTLVVRKLQSETSIFSAELYAIRDSLEVICRSNDVKYTIFTDSKSSIQAIQKYNNNNPIVMDIVSLLIRLSLERKEVKLCWVPSHVNVGGNERADTEAKQAASLDIEPYNRDLPFKDFYPLIRKTMADKWQTQWSNVPETNKLRKIKNTIKPWPSSYNKVRRVEVVLTRLRIGHTRLTHGHLMEGRPLPYCDDCLVPLTIKHILAECPSYIEIRRRLFPNSRNQDVETIYKNMISEPNDSSFNARAVIQYLQDCDILREI